MNRRFALGAILLLTTAPFPARADEAGTGGTLEPGVLRIGTYFVNPPFEFLSDGNRVGFEVDLLSEVARRLRLKPDFVETRWEVILGQMEQGLYDCIVGGITITPERSRMLAWSEPYMTTTLSLIVDTARTPEIRGLEDLKDATVGVQAATTDYDAAVALRTAGRIGAIEVYPFDRIADAMVDLSAGRIAAVMKVTPVAAWLARQGSSLRIIGTVPDDPQPLGIGFAKSNPRLLGAVDRALDAMRRDGTSEALARKWQLT